MSPDAARSDSPRLFATGLPNYSPDQFRPYAPILREIFAVLSPEYRGQTAMALPHKSAEDLEWPRLLERLAHHCTSDEAREAALRLPVLTHRESIQRRLVETEEAVRLLSEEEAPPLRGLTSIRPFLQHAAREGTLDAEHLIAVARAARTADEVRSYFASRAPLAPLLAHLAEDLQTAPEVVGAIEHAFDASGRLVDHASPDLGALRRKVVTCQERIKRRVEEVLRSPAFEGVLQDDYFTVRQERYVLPIRAGAKGSVPGIVHGTSGSGQTIYIEPTEFVELNNDLRLAQLEVADEERRILRRLSALVGAARGRLDANVDLLAYLDLTLGAAHLALELDAYRPELARESELELMRARHPMLVLRSRQAEVPFAVIPNDIRVGQLDQDGEARTVLIVSGPNTGGKTVTLKTIGLCSLMVRAGLLIPAAPGSRVALFSGIFTDVGDDQSIERDLSTFSAHVTNINSFVQAVGKGSLVLMDELFAGTDPAEGAALAVALLEHLRAHGAMVVVTTHLDGVKTVAFHRAGFSNAAMGFDVNRFQPTYELSLGLPGSSYAIRIARKLGLPEPVLRRAEELDAGAGKEEIERVLRELESQRELLALERNRTREIQSEAIRERNAYERKLRELKARNQTWVDAEAKKVLDQLQQAQEQIRQQVAALQAASAQTITHAQIEEARAGLKQVRASVAPVLQSGDAEAPQERFRLGDQGIEEGRTIWVRSFKRQGTILEVMAGREKAIVQVGAVRATVDFKDLFTLTDGEEQRLSAQRSRRAREVQAEVAQGSVEPAQRVVPPPYDDNTLDLRGMTGEDAAERVEFFLDRMAQEGEPGGYLIHGHGTGVLKRVVRELLPKLDFIHSFRAGERTEGGDGVTVVYLR